MKELITRIEELAVQVAGAQLQIDKSEAESRELGRELGKARQKMMELVNERDHALARVPPESWAKENKRLAAQSEDLLGVIERRELLIKSLNDEITKRDHELRAHESELAEQREEIRSIIETATYFGMTSDEGVGNFIKRKCIESEDVRDEIIRAETNLELVRRECEQIQREVPLESTREGLKNAVAKLQEVTTDRDRVLNELAAIVAEANKTGRCGGDPVALIKQGHADWVAMERMERGIEVHSSLSTARALEIRKLMDGHAEDMKAQAEVQSKYESLLAKTTDLGSYAMTIGRKEGEPLEMFMERQALRLAALEAAITAAKCDELAKATARIKPLEALYKTLKGWQENDHIIGYGLTIDVAINKATEALSQITA
jgi:hypothetical protein